MEFWNRKEAESRRFEDEAYVKIQKRYEEVWKHDETRRDERLKLFRIEMTLYLLHESIEFMPTGREQGDEDVVNGLAWRLARLFVWNGTFLPLLRKAHGWFTRCKQKTGRGTPLLPCEDQKRKCRYTKSALSFLILQIKL